MPAARVALLTATAMLAFAANSLLCRQALLHTAIDAASFTGIRLVSGAIALSAFIAVRQKRWPAGGSWISAAALTLYAACFSFAYRSLTAATGALLLFAAVQLSMLGFALIRGTKFAFNQGIGLILAAAGLTVLLLPGVASPPTTGPS